MASKHNKFETNFCKDLTGWSKTKEARKLYNTTRQINQRSILCECLTLSCQISITQNKLLMHLRVQLLSSTR